MLANFEMNLSWSELMKRTARETMSDDAQGLASQLAYYCFLALFPALLCFLAIASFFRSRISPTMSSASWVRSRRKRS